jgi:hypothetical protein
LALAPVGLLVKTTLRKMDLDTRYRQEGLVDGAGAMHRHRTNPIADRSIYTFAETGASAKTG